jgi:ribosomal protein L13E
MKITATVFRKDGQPREGRGFSKKELGNAGLGFAKALKLGVPVDRKRRTWHEENVRTLREYAKDLKKAEAPKKRKA